MVAPHDVGLGRQHCVGCRLNSKQGSARPVVGTQPTRTCIERHSDYCDVHCSAMQHNAPVLCEDVLRKWASRCICMALQVLSSRKKPISWICDVAISRMTYAEDLARAPQAMCLQLRHCLCLGVNTDHRLWRGKMEAHIGRYMQQPSADFRKHELLKARPEHKSTRVGCVRPRCSA